MPAKKVWRPFGEAREFARSLNLRNRDGWYEYRKPGERPNDIPSNPNIIYKNDGWKGWVDWLGNEDRIISEESRKRYSEAKKGKPHSGSFKKEHKINLDRKHSEEAKRKMSEAKIGEKHPMYGKHLSEETKRKLSEAWNNRKLSEEQIKRSEMHNARRNQESNNTLYEICVYEGIKYEPEKKIYLIHFHWHKYRFIKVDVFIEPNICLFADNDLYHANPKPYRTTRDRWYDGHKPNDPWIKAPNSGILAKDIWWEDDGITRDLESQGYKVLRFWGSDLLYYTARCRQEVIGAVRNVE